jgi:hypothetical protein
MNRQQIDGFLMLHVKLERENTWYVFGVGWFHVSRPDTRYVLDTVPSASTVHTRCRDFEYTARRPSPELAGSSSLGGGIVVVVVAGAGTVGVSWTDVPRVGRISSLSSAGPGIPPTVVAGSTVVVGVEGSVPPCATDPVRRITATTDSATPLPNLVCISRRRYPDAPDDVD